jgi:hypothetical protein
MNPEDRDFPTQHEPYTTGTPEEARRVSERRTVETVSRGSMVEAACGIAAVILAIVGLGGGAPGYTLGIATILVGVALFSQGVAIAANYQRLREGVRATWSFSELSSGMGAELFGGAAGIVLGIVGTAVPSLSTTSMVCSVAILIFGAALLVGTGANASLAQIAGARTYWQVGEAIREALAAATGFQVLVGFASIILGIIALAGTGMVILPLVAILAIGTSVVLSGLAMGVRMREVLHH